MDLKRERSYSFALGAGQMSASGMAVINREIDRRDDDLTVVLARAAPGPDPTPDTR